MSCMKCGRDIEEGQVFCTLCLEDMARYPVKPGIAIQLPTRKDTPASKKTHTKRRQPPTPEEQILRLKKRIRRLAVLWLITFLLLAAAAYPAYRFIRAKYFYIPGQNYTTVVTSDAGNP